MPTHLLYTSIAIVTVTVLSCVTCWLAPFVIHIFENGEALHEVYLN